MGLPIEEDAGEKLIAEMDKDGNGKVGCYET
jgi:hypothetical protein